MDLINTGTDPWILEHDACEVLNREILEQLNLRNSQNLSANDSDALSGRIRHRLKQFSLQVDALKSKLTSSGAISSITTEEHQRRKRQVEVLECNFVRLQDEFNKRRSVGYGHAVASEARTHLFARKGDSSTFADLGTTSWGDINVNVDETPRANTSQVTAYKTVDDLRSEQQKLLREQDEGLESLSKIISRQKDIAKSINVEVEEQNDLLDDLTHDMDQVGGRITRETNMVRVIGRKDTVWGYWLVIILLLVAIIGVAVA